MANAAEPVLERGAIELPIIGPLRDRFMGLPRDSNIDVKFNGREAYLQPPGQLQSTLRPPRCPCYSGDPSAVDNAVNGGGIYLRPA